MKNHLARIAVVLLTLPLFGCEKKQASNPAQIPKTPEMALKMRPRAKPEATAPASDKEQDTVTDWPQWGRTPSRNMVSMERDLPLEFEPGKYKEGTQDVDISTTENCLWVAKLGSASYPIALLSPITIGGGKILIGTNNESPRDERHEGDRGIVYCLDEKTGRFLWQLVVPKSGAGKVSDWEYMGICSSPAIYGSRAYVITNRCEVLCMDMNGFADGNQGMKDEATYMAGPGEPPIDPADTDADIIWVYDMRAELGAFPHNVASSSPLLVGDRVYVSTTNGVDWSHLNIPAPDCPSLICLDKKTGELIGEENAGISRRLLHCSWSSPSYGVVNGMPQVFFGAGDGWCYGFSLDTKPLEEDGEVYHLMEELWRYDANPTEYRFDDFGMPIRYAAFEGPSEIIGTPVLYKERLYVMIGQDAHHGEGLGMFSCIDPSMRGNLSGKAVWTFKGIERGMSTPSIVDDLVYIADLHGRVFCLDAETGQNYWEFDTEGHILGSTLVADGKVYIGNEEGELYILSTGKTLHELAKIEFPAPIMGTPVAANGVLYIATATHLYAFKK